MNKDRAVGAGRNIIAKGEHKIGDASGNGGLEGHGLVDEIAGAVESSVGRLIDRVTELLEDTPALLVSAVAQGRDAGRRGDAAVRKTLGNIDSRYLFAGAFALLALGSLAIKRK